MQNKPNLRKSQMNVNPYNTMAYEYKHDWTLGENKPNSNPIQTQSNPILPASGGLVRRRRIAKNMLLRLTINARLLDCLNDSTTIISAVFSKCSLIKILIRLQIGYNTIVSVVLPELNYEARFGQTNRCRTSRPLRGRRGDCIP